MEECENIVVEKVVGRKYAKERDENARDLIKTNFSSNFFWDNNGLHPRYYYALVYFQSS